MTQQEALLVLNAIPGLSGAVIGKLIRIFGSAEKLLEQKEDELRQQGLSQNCVTNIVHFPKDKFLQDEHAYLQKLSAEYITRSCEDYPSLLAQVDHPPIVLYIKGKRAALRFSSIALVGSRKASSYGLKVAEEFAHSFAQAKMTVVSGGAYGIDTVSHKGALKAQGKTIAVLGCGLNHIYPKENARLFEEIAEQGAVVSEFPLNTAPINYNFPRRNRIISGLSLATIVIEAAERSGALITADFALAQNREVFAVPGSIHNEYSSGTNRLIKEGAKMALSVKEILEELGFEMGTQLLLQHSAPEIQIKLSEDEHEIYKLITHEAQHIDIIASHLSHDVGFLMGQMLNLELKGAIKQLPGQYYARI